MKTLAWAVMVALAVGAPAAFAQKAPPASSAPAEKPQSVPLPDTGIPPSMAPALRQQQGLGDSTNVTARVDANGDKIEEYRRGGVVYMVRVTPKNGVPQTYVYSSASGSLMHNPNLGPVSPVYFDLYKWNGPRKPAKPAAGTVNAPPPPMPPQSASSSG